MQCFQKDHNLRVSARKLLKHPWIVSARRSDAVVQKASTEYEEAVKSVQEWNEALKSPDNTLRKASRPLQASPIPPRREAKTPVQAAQKARVVPEDFRSPTGPSDDNWDNDFESSISASALQLPHLKPQDHFGGKLSAEKLKSYASMDAVAEENDNWDNNFEGDLTVKSPLQLTHTDHHLQTVRPYFPGRAEAEDVKTTAAARSPTKSSQLVPKQSPTKRTSHVKQKKSEAKARPVQPSAQYRDDTVEDYSDLIVQDDGIFDSKRLFSNRKEQVPPRLFHPSDLISSPISHATPTPMGVRQPPAVSLSAERRTRSSVEIQRYAEDEHDEDFSDIFGRDPASSDQPHSDPSASDAGGTLMLNSKLSSSWLGDDDDEDDPFAQLEDGFDAMDLEANVARDKYARLCTQVAALVGSLKVTQADDVLAELAEELLAALAGTPEVKSVVVSAHGLLPILEVLEVARRRDITHALLRIVNCIVADEVEIQENLCFVGGIPIITRFAHKRYPREIRREAAAFVRQMCATSTLTLQMLVSSGGLRVLVEFLEEDFEDERDLVLIGVNGVWSVFESQGRTPKNDFCRILSRSTVLDPLSLVLSRVLDEKGELAERCEERIANIFLFFSQAENYVKELVAERTVLHRERLSLASAPNGH